MHIIEWLISVIKQTVVILKIEHQCVYIVLLLFTIVSSHLQLIIY